MPQAPEGEVGGAALHDGAPPPIVESSSRKGDFLFTVPYLSAMAGFFLVLTGNGFFVLYPLRLDELGKNEAAVGFLMGVMALAAFLTRPFIGSRIDRRGRRAFVVGGSLAMALAMALYAVPLTADWYLTVVRMLHGAAFAAFFTAIFTWVADYAPPERLAEGVGLFGIAGLLASSSGPWLGETALRLSHGRFTPFFFSAAAVTLCGCAVLLALKDPPRASHTPAYGFRGLLRRFDFITVAVISIVFGAAVGVVTNFMANYSREVSLGSVAPFFTAYAAAAVLTRLFAGRAADRLGRTALIVPAIALFCVGHIALSSTALIVPAIALFRAGHVAVPSPALVHVTAAIGLLMGCGHGLIYPAMNALAMERAGEKDRGSANALFTGAVDVGVFLGSLAFGEVAKALGCRTAYFYSGIAVLAGLAVFLVLEKVVCRTCEDRPRGRG